MDRKNVQPTRRADPNLSVAIADAEAQPELRTFWDEKIQPHIDRSHALNWSNYIALKAATPKADLYDLEKQLRADAGWRWSGVNQTTLLSYAVGKANRQQPHRYALCLQRGPDLIPVGMLLLAEQFTFEGKGCVFVWYLSTAPKEALAELKVAAPKPLGKLLLDHAITRSYHLGHEGRILLHAAPQGLRPLFEWYHDEVKLSLVPNPPDPISARRPNDGRYFEADEKLALKMSEAMDEFRGEA